VWLEEDGTTHIVVGCFENLTSAMFEKDRYNGELYNGASFNSDPHYGAQDFTYLGKFDEVYVKISDVREALKHQVFCGINYLSDTDFEALRKLNIITD
jgi:hypothetical protein